MRESIVFYKSYYEAIKELPVEQQVKIYEAIFEFGFYGNELKTTGIEKVVFNLIKPTLNSSVSRYSASVENGRKGGAPKGNTNAKKQPKNNLENNLEQPKNNLNYNYNYNDTYTYNDTYNENENENENVAVDVNDKSEPATATNVFDFYFQNINPAPSSIEVDKIKELQNEYADELICYAIEKAVERKVRNLSYIKAILSSWNSKGITTRQEAEEEKKIDTEEEEAERRRRLLEREGGIFD